MSFPSLSCGNRSRIERESGGAGYPPGQVAVTRSHTSQALCPLPPAHCQRKRTGAAPPLRPARGQVRSQRRSVESQTPSRRGAGLGSGGERAVLRPLTGLSSAPFSRPWLRRGPAPRGLLTPTPRLRPASWSGSVRGGGKSAVSASGCSMPRMGRPLTTRLCGWRLTAAQGCL